MIESQPDGTENEKLTVKSVGMTMFTGFLVGIGSIAPGISGGAIAVIFGLYSRITDAIANFYKDFFNKMKFLVPLGIGAGISILLFGKIIKFLFANYNLQTSLLFVGLMVGTIPSLIKASNKQGFKKWYILPFLGTFGFTLIFAYLEKTSSTGVSTELTLPLLFVCGAILGFGTIVPGISSSFIMISLGWYEPLLGILTNLDIIKIIPIGIGFGVFVLLFAKLIDWLYKVAYGLVSYLVCGLVVGSIFPVIPQLSFDLTTVLSVLLAISGAFLSWYLLRIKTKEI